MPYSLKNYQTGALIAETDAQPQATGQFEQFSQAGWNPPAQALGLAVNTVYRLDDPNGGVHRQIRLDAVGAGQNALTYTRQGVA